MLCGVGIWRWEEDFCVVTKLSLFTTEWPSSGSPWWWEAARSTRGAPSMGSLSSSTSAHQTPVISLCCFLSPCCVLAWSSFQVVHVFVRARSLQLYPTLCDPMDRSPPGSSVHGILQARILEWVAMPSPRGSSQPRDRTQVFYVSCIDRQVLYH